MMNIGYIKYITGHQRTAAILTLLAGIFVKSWPLALVGIGVGIIAEGLQVFFSFPHREKWHRGMLDALDFGFGGAFAASVILGVPWYISLPIAVVGVGYGVLITELEALT